MSPVDRAGPVFEISTHPLIPLKKCPRIHMSGGQPCFPRTRFFQPGSQELGKNFSHTSSSDENKKFIFLTESSYFFFLFCDRENYEARTGAHIHLIQYNPGNCQPGSCEEALRTAPLLVQLMLLWTNQKCCRYLARA